MTLEQGSILKGRYQVDGIIAQGGMGAIYMATDIALSVTVALKENLFSESVAIRQFRAEAQILANLRHPNLPRVTDHFEIENQGQYLVMDFIDGEDIKDLLNQKGVFSEEEAIRIGISVCDALDYLHRRNPPVVHRDIKPGNVKFNSAGVVHLVDFGLAKQAIAGEQTMTGAQALTPGFAPPEQYGQGTDPRTDIYSLGATLFAAVTMEAPPDGLTRATSNATYLDIEDRNPEISKEFSDVINHAMAVSVGDRYQTAKEFKAALEGLKKSGIGKDNAVIGADSSPTVVQSAGAAHKKKQWWIPVAAIGVLAVIVVVLVSLLSGIGSNGNDPTSTAMAAMAEEPLLLTETEQSEDPVLDPATQTPTATAAAATETIAPTEEIIEVTATPEVIVPLATPVGGGGSLIAFASDRANGIPQIFLMNVDTQELTQLTSLDKGACQPDWSPDGQQIVFTSPCLADEVDYKGSRLYITSVDGSALRPLNTIPGGDFDPAWNPVNPNQIAFVSYRENNRPHLFIYNLDTNAVEGFSASAAYDRAPVWSNDGEMLLFQKVFNGLTQVYTIQLSDKKLASITNGLTDAFDPAWSNSGLLVYFSEGTMGGLSVKLAGVQYGNAAGTKFELEEPRPVWGIDFSNDDNWVVFYGIGDGNNRDIFIMPSFGGNTDQLTDDAAQDFDPKWQPVIAP
jgi:serine/threonine protein kinase